MFIPYVVRVVVYFKIYYNNNFLFQNTVGTKRGLTVRQPPDLGPPAVPLPLTAVQTGRMASAMG